MKWSSGLHNAAAGLIFGYLSLSGCAADPSKPTDAALTCPLIAEEIASEDAKEKLSERRAGELRTGYYVYQSATFIPILGDVMAVGDMVTDVSNGRELDRLNKAAGDARHRREYLVKMQSTRCPAAAVAFR